MYHIMLSYPLFGPGMEILKNETDLFVSNSGEIAPYMDELKKADAFITRNVHPTTDQLKECPNLKIIGIPGAGYQSYDLDYLNSRGLAIVYCPGMNGRSVAEHALAMTLSLAKQIVRDDAEVKNGNYSIRNRFDHQELMGRNVGIAGFGSIGRQTAQLFAAIGMQVYVYDPYVSGEKVEAMGYHFCLQLNEMLSAADVISLHMPSLPTTYHMFSHEQFSAMKDGVIFVNCARGSVVDEKALLEALNAGKIAAAGLDVMEKEPFDSDSALLSHPRVLVSPHVAGVTEQSSRRIHLKVVESTLQLLSGHRVDNVANPEALNHPDWKSILK